MEHKFQIHLRGIIDLLSNHLYSEPDVFVRELLQNGVDAIRARSYIDPAHAGEITIDVHNRPGKPPTLVFTDNGVGLTEEEIHKFLATIGESSKRAGYRDQPVDFIGQFGIGLLSCFVVSEEIVVLTRSVKDGGHKAMEWRGRPDGTYTLKTIDADIAPGTQVFLTCKKGSEEHFLADRVRERVKHYGGLLPFPIRVTEGKRTDVVNENCAPWRQEYRSDRERTRALLEFGREALGSNFFDAIPLRSKVGAVDGVAFVLPFTPNLATKQTHRVYLKNMLLSEAADNLLPDWAFFVKAVVNANDLRPTASRESFYEDDKLEAARDALGECLRNYLLDLSKRDQRRLEQFIALHQLSIKALAVQDDEFYKLFIHWLKFETSMGDMTLGDYREQHDSIRYVADVDQFRQIARVAGAQGVCVVNGGYTHDAELLAKYADVFPEVPVESVDPVTMAQSFDDLEMAEQEQVHDFLRTADAALQPFRCAADAKKYLPKELPALYSIDREGKFLRSLEQTKEIANPLMKGVLENISRRKKHHGPAAQLLFNFHNPLVQRLTTVRDRSLVMRSVQMLYIQALLLGHHPLSSKEMALLNDGLLALI
ncbi:MAG: HSP90 family protein, partial [Gemmataceae bacterium]